MRTFIAAPLPEELLKKLAALQIELKKRLASENLRPSWVRPEGIHLTLCFLGEIEEKLSETVCTRLEEVCRISAPLELEVKGLGAFPNPQRPRVLWVGLHGDNRLSMLAERVRKSLADLPLEPDDKPFRPHLTLARIKEYHAHDITLGRLIEERRDEHFSALPVDEIRLYRSHLKSSGAEYEVLESFKLGR